MFLMDFTTNKPLLNFQNNVFHRPISLSIASVGQITTGNNLFYRIGTNGMEILYNGAGASPNININNAIDQSEVYFDGIYSSNAYLNGCLQDMTAESNAVTGNMMWLAGPLGSFYQTTNSPLTNAGNTTADLVSLYHYTAQITGQKESNSIVDIGYHYVALGSDGLPVDSNGNGIPDYLEDGNGSGRVVVTLIAPTNGASFMEPANIPVQAIVSDWMTVVTNVEILRDSVHLTGFSSGPYVFSWPIVPAGSYSLTAVAHDAAGTSWNSIPITINVTNFCSH